MNSKKKTKTTSRLPSVYGQTLIKSKIDYQHEMRRKLDQLQRNNRDSLRRHLANDHIFAQSFLTKRHQWFTIDKSYRDLCRTRWNKQTTESSRTSHLILPNIYSSESSSRLTVASSNTSISHEEEDSAVTDERIKQDFLRVQPVLLEILRTPHSSKVLKYKQAVELRKKSAQKRQIHIQTTATNDNRYTELVGSLERV